MFETNWCRNTNKSRKWRSQSRFENYKAAISISLCLDSEYLSLRGFNKRNSKETSENRLISKERKSKERKRIKRNWWHDNCCFCNPSSLRCLHSFKHNFSLVWSRKLWEQNRCHWRRVSSRIFQRQISFQDAYSLQRVQKFHDLIVSHEPNSVFKRYFLPKTLEWRCQFNLETALFPWKMGFD